MVGYAMFAIRLYEKFKYISHLRNKPIKILDVGCGNRSPQLTKRFFPYCEYHGIDREIYNLTEIDLRLMDKFYVKDLDVDDLQEIPDNYFDYVIVSHVLEHLHNAYSVLEKLTDKVKEGGYIYLEFPSIKSFSLPSMHGTLHFCDDPTHVKLVEISKVINILLERKFRLIKAGRRRNYYRIAMMPIVVVYHLLKYRKIFGSAFWDILGFADQVLAKKTRGES